MIKGIFIINNHGKARLAKFFEQVSYDDQQTVIRELFSVVSQRPGNVCSFVEGSISSTAPQLTKGTKVIYRHYATLYFIFLVDESESELGILDLIQVLVECLDRAFENVCELDIIFNVDKVHYIVDEIVIGGLVLETNIVEIMTAVEQMNKLDARSVKA